MKFSIFALVAAATSVLAAPGTITKRDEPCYDPCVSSCTLLTCTGNDWGVCGGTCAVSESPTMPVYTTPWSPPVLLTKLQCANRSAEVPTEVLRKRPHYGRGLRWTWAPVIDLSLQALLSSSILHEQPVYLTYLPIVPSSCSLLIPFIDTRL